MHLKHSEKDTPTEYGDFECSRHFSTIHDLHRAGFGLESGSDERLLPWVADVSCLRSVLPFGPGETSCTLRMVGSAG